MTTLRAWCLPLLGLATLLFSACQHEPPRATAHPPQLLRVAIALVSDTGNLSYEQLQTHRAEVLAYVSARGLLIDGDVLSDTLIDADRIIRVIIGDEGGFKITVFDSPAVLAARGASRTYSVGGSYWVGPDPFFDSGLYYRSGPDRGYYPYHPTEVPRSQNPNAPQPGRPSPAPPRTDPPSTRPPGDPDHHPNRPTHPTPRDNPPPRDRNDHPKPNNPPPRHDTPTPPARPSHPTPPRDPSPSDNQKHPDRHDNPEPQPAR